MPIRTLISVDQRKSATKIFLKSAFALRSGARGPSAERNCSFVQAYPRLRRSFRFAQAGLKSLPYCIAPKALGGREGVVFRGFRLHEEQRALICTAAAKAGS